MRYNDTVNRNAEMAGHGQWMQQQPRHEGTNSEERPQSSSVKRARNDAGGSKLTRAGSICAAAWR